MLRIGVAVVLLLALLYASTSHSAFVYASNDDRAVALVRSAIEKMGGEQKLRLLKSVQIERMGHTYSVEQSERPEGPWLVNYEQLTDLRDYDNQRVLRTTQTRSVQSKQWSPPVALKVTGGAAALQFGERSGPASAIDMAEAEESLDLSADRVLITALEAKNLRVEADTSLQGGNQHVVAFSWRNGLVRLYLNAHTSMLTAIEVEGSYPGSFIWGPWGDIRTRVYLSLWTLESGGIRYPHQWDIERNGIPYQSFTVTSLTFNTILDANLFSIPAEVRKAYELAADRKIDDTPLGQPNKPAVEIAPGVIQISGPWNVTLVRQSEGIVVIEAPISSGYSDKVLAEAKKRFPDLPIKAVISTSDAWPHIGGVREYVASDIPVYALDLNRPILERLIASRNHLRRDALERQPKKARFKVISKKTTVGSGRNRLDIYPIRTESGERMMVVFFPEHNLLYGSDLVQQRRDGSFFMPEYLKELVEATIREKLTISSVFAMHLGLTSWREIGGGVTKAEAKAIP